MDSTPRLVPPPPPFAAIVAVVDMEGFTKFCAPNAENESPRKIAEALTGMTEFHLKSWDEQYRSDGQGIRSPDIRKFTGDGLILVWELAAIEKDPLFSVRVIKGMRLLQKNFGNRSSEWAQISGARPPRRIRVGISKGLLFRVRTAPSTRKYDDFIGHPVNLACRLQKLDFGFVVSKELGEEALKFKSIAGLTTLLLAPLPELSGCSEREAFVFSEDFESPRRPEN